MNIGFLASFITFSLLVSYNIKKQARRGRRNEKNFWAREAQANSVRRKPLDGLNYVKIPLERFPTHVLNENPEVLECIGIMESLTPLKIVNLTGWTNTELKLEYGAANITALSEYDQNYTLLARTLQKWADALLEAGLDVPQVTELMHSLRQAGLPVREDIITEEECSEELCRLLGEGGER